MDFGLYRQELEVKGFVVINDVFNTAELKIIGECIEKQSDDSPHFKKSKDLFAIRKVLKELPALKSKIFSNSMVQSVIFSLFGPDYFLVKSLYFDKPSFSNWFVAYHQDLSVSVANKVDTKDFINWTVKDNQYGVQPPLSVLESIYTIRIHLDDCTSANGALHVIPGSHKKGIYRPAEIDWEKEAAIICEVPKSGIMIMRPLLLHASHKSTEDRRRRVLHLEFCNTELTDSIQWAEKEFIR